MKATNSQTPRRRFLASLVLVVVTFPGLLQAQFTYTITTNLTVVITGYTGAGGSVTIPATLSGFPVTGIESQAFQNNQIITNVSIPNTVLTIASLPFLGCYNLVGVNVDTGNQHYSSSDGVLFDKSQSRLIECPAGKSGSYAVPDTVTDIGLDAFNRCLITSVSIPENVTNMETYAFYSCSSLTNVATGAITIGDSAFQQCMSLASLTISNGVTDIGTSAFENCQNLFSLAIPSSVTNLGSSAFLYCTALTNLTIGAKVIGISAFGGCNNLKSVTFGNGVTTIGDHAFFGVGLTSITIPDSVIYLSGFNACAALTNVTIGNGVTTIGDSAFAGCASLSNLTMGESVRTIGNSAFSTCAGLSYFQMSDSVTNIGSRAFEYCANLTDVIVSKSASYIGSFAFVNCTKLSGVYFEGTPPVADPTVFMSANISIIYYFPGTPGWGPVFANRPALPWLPQILTGDPSFGVKSNSFGFNVFWTSGINVVVEGSTDLAKSVWVPLATNNLTTGSFYFADPQWTNYPARFYRVHSL